MSFTSLCGLTRSLCATSLFLAAAQACQCGIFLCIGVCFLILPFLSYLDKMSHVEDLEKRATSALHENIKSKGANSYYYAHGSTAPPEQRYTSGDGPPQLVGGGAAAAPAPTPSLTLLPITTYSWADDEAEVVVYIPLETLEGLSKESLELSHTSDSLKLLVPVLEKAGASVGGGGSVGGSPALVASATKKRAFLLSGLHAEITGVRAILGAKNSRIVLKLVKKEAGSWYRLLKADRPYSGEED